MIKLGYHPDPDAHGSLLERFEFAKGLVLDESVGLLFDAIPEIRTGSASETGLPAGLYWFAGIDEPLLMQVAAGPTGASAEIELESFDAAPDHPLVEAFRWSQHLWLSGAAVPEPLFQLGARAMTLPGGVDVEIRSRSYYAERWSYMVRGPGGSQSFIENKLGPVEFSDQPEDWVLGERSSAARLGATLTRTKLDGRFADTIYSFQATRTVFRPYQFKPVLKLLQTGQARLLIADEVGLGKTIEAGLIWTELEARHDADRVLIVCPSGLVDKWRDEMQERFGFELTILNSEELARLLEQHREGRVPKRKAYVVSLETLRSWDALEELQDSPPEFDLVIVDEAHAMRNSNTKSYQLGTQLSEWTIGSNMVFLTATPINLRETDLLHLLGLLEPADFDTMDDLEARLAPNAVLNEVGRQLTRGDSSADEFRAIVSKLEGMVFEKAITLRPEFGDLLEILDRAPLVPRDIAGARRLIGKLNALSTTVTRTRRAEVDEKKALRDASGIPVTWHPAESEFYSEYLVWCSARAKAAKTAMYFSMQMPLRLASTSVHLAAATVLNDDPEVWEGDSEGRAKNWVDPHPALVAAAKRVLESTDTKLSALGKVLSELHELGRPALLFTWSKKTLRYLQAAYGDKYRIAVMNGDVPRRQRRTIMKEFRAGGYDFLFANKVASEGLDFEFCSAVINYDLPWNPMEVEQRIGRIDRIGQQSEKILIRNFYNDEAIDARIMYRVLQRIEIFERSIGELEPIIGQHMDLLKAAMDFDLTLEEQEEKAQQFYTAIEAQKDLVRDVADSAAGLIISNDVEIAGLEEELTSTGRYLGQVELAHLLDDWSQTDGGERLSWLEEGRIVELRGNPTMAGRLVNLTQLGLRTRSETGVLIGELQNNAPIYLSLEQELARTSEVELLSATHPLVMAAVQVPGHRHARFASVRIPSTDRVAPGRYVVVLAHAQHASRGGDEIWGAAVDEQGSAVGEGPADAVLAALARGSLMEGSDSDIEGLPRLVNRAKRELERRHGDVQDKRDSEEAVLSETRRAILADQHERRMKGIARRMQTMLDRDRGSGVLRMVEGQSRRQRERYEQLVAETENKKPDAVALRYIAVCHLEVG